MQFFFPDSQDFVDPSFDFVSEIRSETRVRQRDDRYPHEVFESPPYDGLLVSKAIVYGNGSASGKYSIAQRNRLLRTGAREFFRLDERESSRPLQTMGDNGAFSYVKEEVPPFSVDELIEFYALCDFDIGISLDHVIPVFDPSLDESLALPGIGGRADVWRNRQELTLELAESFLRQSGEQGVRFEPMGVAQGWSAESYSRSLAALQTMGYERIAIGGLVPLKTPEILATLNAIGEVRKPHTRLHLLGVTRPKHLEDFERLGVESFDSTSPLRQAFKDDRDNYYLPDGGTHVAIRVPQVEGNDRLKRRILAGEVEGQLAKKLERQCLRLLESYDREEASLEDLLGPLLEYETLCNPRFGREKEYREVLTARPWKECPCTVCRRLGIHVIIFRGAERNRRRGFHNLFVFYQRLQEYLAIAQ